MNSVAIKLKSRVCSSTDSIITGTSTNALPVPAPPKNLSNSFKPSFTLAKPSASVGGSRPQLSLSSNIKHLSSVDRNLLTATSSSPIIRVRLPYNSFTTKVTSTANQSSSQKSLLRPFYKVPKLNTSVLNTNTSSTCSVSNDRNELAVIQIEKPLYKTNDDVVLVKKSNNDETKNSGSSFNEFVVLKDMSRNFNLIIRRLDVFSHSARLLLDCVICYKRVDTRALIAHLKHNHRLLSVKCPDAKCINLREFYLTDYIRHLEQVHFYVNCKICRLSYHASQHFFHQAEKCLPLPKDTEPNIEAVRTPESLEKEKVTSNDVSACEIVVNLPQKETSIKTEDFVKNGYLSFGDIVMVDGVVYLIRNNVIYLDCPFCNSSCSLSLIGSHIRHKHGAASFNCFSVCCRSMPSEQTVQTHMLLFHGSVRCEMCAKPLCIRQVKSHVMVHCELLHFITSQAINENSSVVSKSILYGPVRTRLINEVITANLRLPLNNADGALAPPKAIYRIGMPKTTTVPCPLCMKQCIHLNKHLRDVHHPKINCHICGKRMAKSYMADHMKIQHLGKHVKTKVCPLCRTPVQKVKNHLRFLHKMTKDQADQIYDIHFPPIKSRTGRLNSMDHLDNGQY